MTTRNLRAHEAAKSKPVTVPAPCKNTSGDPPPASSTTVSTPLIFKWRRVKWVMVGPRAGAPRQKGTDLFLEKNRSVPLVETLCLWLGRCKREKLAEVLSCVQPVLENWRPLVAA